ncbi:MAG: energy-coupling factor ABC transporter permease [Bacillota bacterium]
MSHLHIPDGILPFYWPLLGFIVSGLIIAIVLYRLRSRDINKLVPRLGIVSAFVLVVMSVPLGFIPYHLNLTVLAGIILGPGLGFISVFMVNLLLGFIGHGGITMVGLNSLAVGSEVFIGYYLFRQLIRHFKYPGAAAALTTVLTLVISSLVMISVVAGSQVDPAMFVDRHETEVHTEAGRTGEEHADEVHTDDGSKLSVARFAAMVLPFTGLGIILESLAISSIVRFLWRVRPDILGEQAGQAAADADRLKESSRREGADADETEV